MDGFTGSPDQYGIRREVLWGNLMAGGAGVEYYFGDEQPHSDLTCQDFRSRDATWDDVRHALTFFNEYVEFWKMKSMDYLVSAGSWCFAAEGEAYVIYILAGYTGDILLNNTATYQVAWFDPRNGGDLQPGSQVSVTGRGVRSLGTPPDLSFRGLGGAGARVLGENRPPEAVIMADNLSGDLPLTVLFDGSASTDDGEIISWFWDFGDGDTLSGAVVEHIYKVEGVFPVSLVVTDDQGATDVAYDTITVTTEILSPCGAYLEIFSRDFPYQESGFYLDDLTGEELLAIRPSTSPVSATVNKPFPGESCYYDVVFHGIGESDGGSVFRIMVNGRLVGEYTLPLSTMDWEAGDAYNLTIEEVSIFNGDTIRVEGTTASADGTGWSRARWLKVEFIPRDFIPDFFEVDGLAVIEAESFPLGEQWVEATSRTGYTGEGYMYWKGSEHFNSASYGRMGVTVHISNPGTYCFDWRVGIASGTSSTEHNDTWLKVTGDDFYGYKSSEASYVHPKPVCQQAGTYDCPEGSSVDGYFKIYGGTLTGWIWKAVTNDNNDHRIFATFDRKGVYRISIAARSSYHCIDRMVLYKVGSVTESTARSLSNEETINPVFIVPPDTSTIGMDPELAGFWFYPNPAYNSVFFEGLDQVKTIRIMSMTGKVLVTRNVSREKEEVEVAGFEKGLYLVVLESRSGQQVTRKLIRN